MKVSYPRVTAKVLIEILRRFPDKGVSIDGIFASFVDEKTANMIRKALFELRKKEIVSRKGDSAFGKYILTRKGEKIIGNQEEGTAPELEKKLEYIFETTDLDGE